MLKGHLEGQGNFVGHGQEIETTVVVEVWLGGTEMD